MKKNNVILIVVIILFCRIGAMAQVLNFESRIKQSIDSCPNIIEGRIIDSKRVNHRTDKARDLGDFYSVLRIKITSVFKGTIDTSKIYEVLIDKGTYLNDPSGDGSFVMPNPHQINVPDAGIYFFTKETNPPDFYQPSNDAIFVEFYNAISYDKTNRIDAFKFLEEKYSLQPILIVSPVEEKKSLNELTINS
jgi:hypothetical protein